MDECVIHMMFMFKFVKKIYYRAMKVEYISKGRSLCFLCLLSFFVLFREYSVETCGWIGEYDLSILITVLQ